MDSPVPFVFRPLDPLFFRDGKPFGESTRAMGGLPQPQTLAGALRTRLLASQGFDFREFSKQIRQSPSNPPKVEEILRQTGAKEWIIEAKFRGPWLCLIPHDNGPAEPLLPTPLTLARFPKEKEKPGQWAMARPKEGVPGWNPPAANLLPLWRKKLPDAKYPGGYLTVEGINLFLEGKTPEDLHWFEDKELFGTDSRTGIGIDPDRLAAEESKIYSISLLALRPKLVITKINKETNKEEEKTYSVGLGAEVTPGPGAPESWKKLLEGPIPFGGEGKYVKAQQKGFSPWKEPTTDKHTSYLLITPGFFLDDKGPFTWRPKEMSEAVLKAAAAGQPVAISGWDIARGGPRPMRFAAPAGSVYFYENQSPNNPFSGDAEGWGHALKGTWNYV